MTNLSMYVPHIWKSELDAEATAFLGKYYPDAIKKPMCVPIEHIATEVMHLKVVEHHLSEDLSILGQMCFTDGMAERKIPLSVFTKEGLQEQFDEIYYGDQLSQEVLVIGILNMEEEKWLP